MCLAHKISGTKLAIAHDPVSLILSMFLSRLCHADRPSMYLSLVFHLPFSVKCLSCHRVVNFISPCFMPIWLWFSTSTFTNQLRFSFVSWRNISLAFLFVLGIILNFPKKKVYIPLSVSQLVCFLSIILIHIPLNILCIIWTHVYYYFRVHRLSACSLYTYSSKCEQSDHWLNIYLYCLRSIHTLKIKIKNNQCRQVSLQIIINRSAI